MFDVDVRRTGGTTMDETELGNSKKIGRCVRNFDARSPFSNFYPCKIRVKEKNINGYQEAKIFTCTEQYYMYHKALSFYDYETAFAIMEETEANRIKKLGRYVRNFDPARWEKVGVEVMRRGNMEKYIQNSELRYNLFLTLGSRMVECSPTDIFWGIGLDIEDSNASNPTTWRGENHLGKILTEIRDDLSKRKEYAREVEGALRYVKCYDDDAGNYFNDTNEGKYLYDTALSISFAFPFTCTAANSMGQSAVRDNDYVRQRHHSKSNHHHHYHQQHQRRQEYHQHFANFLPIEHSFTEQILFSPTFFRQRRKRKSNEDRQIYLQHSNSSTVMNCQRLTGDIKHIRHKGKDSDSCRGDIVDYYYNSRENSADLMDGEVNAECAAKENASALDEFGSNVGSNGFSAADFHTHSYVSNNLFQKKFSSFNSSGVSLESDLSSTSERHLSYSLESNMPSGSSKVDDCSVTQITDDELGFLDLKMSDDRCVNLLAKCQSKSCDLRKQNSGAVLPTD